MLRYSNRPIIGTMELDPEFYILGDRNVSSNVDGFNHELSSLLGSLRKTAAAGGSLRKYATGDATTPDFKTDTQLPSAHQICHTEIATIA